MILMLEIVLSMYLSLSHTHTHTTHHLTHTPGTVGYRAPELIGSRIWRYQQSRGSLTGGSLTALSHSDAEDSPTSSPTSRRLNSHTSLKRLAENVVGGSPTSASRKKRDHYDRAVDVFSFGVVMYELFCRKRAFRDEAERRWKSRQQKVFPWQIDHIVTTGYRPRITICPPAIAALIRRCWAEDPNVRPAFGDVSKQLESVYYRHVESKMSPKMSPHRVSVFKRDEESPRISRVAPPLAPTMTEFHLDARARIGGHQTSCSLQPEQRSLLLRRNNNNKIPLHGIFTGDGGEFSKTKISRSCSPSMFTGRIKTYPSPVDEEEDEKVVEEGVKKENNGEEEDDDQWFAVEATSSAVVTPMKTQTSGLLREILSTPESNDSDWFNTSNSLHPTPSSERTNRLITPPKPLKVPTPMSSTNRVVRSLIGDSSSSSSSHTIPRHRLDVETTPHWRGATGVSTQPTTTSPFVNRNLFGAGMRNNEGGAEDFHVSLSEEKPSSPFRTNRPKVREGRKRSYSCD